MSGTTTGFLARLDDASTTIRAERKDITPIKAKAEGAGRQSSKDSPSPMPALDQHARPDSSADSKHMYKCEDEDELHTAEEKGGSKSENDDLDSKREKSEGSVEKGKALDSERDSEGEGEESRI